MHADRSDARKASRSEFSAGGVVYRRSANGIKILLIRSSRPDDKERWTFPKGLVGDHGEESVEEAALREVREEGGVEAKIVADLGKTTYFFVWEGQRIAKTVHHYLMEYVAGDPNDHDEEVAEARFAPAGEVVGILAYDTDKEVFQRAEGRLRNIMG